MTLRLQGLETRVLRGLRPRDPGVCSPLFRVARWTLHTVFAQPLKAQTPGVTSTAATHQVIYIYFHISHGFKYEIVHALLKTYSLTGSSFCKHVRSF